MSGLPFVQGMFQKLQAAHRAQNFGSVCDVFIDTVTVDPDIGFRYFMVRASDAVAAALRQTQRGPEIVAVLDGLLAGHPDMHLLVDYDPELIRRCVDLRASNIALGLSSVVVVTQPKSASIPIANIFCSGFNLPSFAYSLANVEVIQSWARDYARGGACYVTHLEPSAQNIDRLKQASIEKVIVHVRDPRQSLLSMIHHLTRYPNNLPALSRNAFDGRSISDQVSELMDFYIRRIRWIQGWMDAESRLSAMFSTFEEFVRDRTAFIDRYINFYGAPREHFSFENATRIQEGTDQHFRAGLIDEWREVFPPAEAELLTACLPTAMKERFGWAD